MLPLPSSAYFFIYIHHLFQWQQPFIVDSMHRHIFLDMACIGFVLPNNCKTGLQYSTQLSTIVWPSTHTATFQLAIDLIPFKRFAMDSQMCSWYTKTTLMPGMLNVLGVPLLSELNWSSIALSISKFYSTQFKNDSPQVHCTLSCHRV